MFQGFTTAPLTDDYLLVYLDGGDGASDQFNSFISNNITALQTYVTAGGHLLINAASWTGGFLDTGFGAALEFNPSYTLASSSGTAADPNNPIFNGPNGSAGTFWTGNWFSHDIVVSTGASLRTLITGSAGAVLVDENRPVFPIPATAG